MMENTSEVWQVDAGGQIYETNFEEMTQWISEGALLPQDKVKRGNLRWIEAQKVPQLTRFFNAKIQGETNQVITSTTAPNAVAPAEVQSFSINSTQIPPQNFDAPPPPTAYQELNSEVSLNYCCVHTDAKAKYHCETCGNYFCKACPKNSICIMCGATCVIVNQPITAPAAFSTPIPTANPNQEVFIDDDTRKSAYWFYWKAGFTVVNSILMMAGIYWQFFLGLALPQLFHGILVGISELSETKEGFGKFHGMVFVFAVISSALTALFGYQAGKAKKWAIVLGIIIFSFDGLLYLLTFSLFGVLIHGFGIYSLCKGYSGCNRT